MSVDKYISPYVASQFPRLYREEGPAFIHFVKSYYEWMEQEGGVLYDAKRLPEYRDIDTTLVDYLVHFKNKYMTGLPENALGDKRTLQKHIKEIYSSKGTSQGLELLFRLLFNESSDVYLPGDDILRPSDGVWTQPIYLEVSVNPFNVLLIGEKITGRESRATAIVEDYQVRYINKRQINILFLSNVRGDFKTNELILSSVIEDPLKSATVIGSMSEILINESGFGFSIGDVLEVGSGSGTLGKAVVSSVSPRNGAVSFTIMNGGSGFANNNSWAPNIIDVTAVDGDNPGIGADFEIGDIENTEVIVTAVDIIDAYANTQLNSPDYQFPTAVGVENINTPLDQALNVQNITVGTIKTLRAINPGAGYNGPVVVTIDSPIISGLMIQDEENGNYKGNNAVVDGKAAAGNGAIDTVKILNSGIGYANGDIITLTNANVPFVASGVAILSKQGKGEGFWKDTRSFLNSDKYIQDSFYYQEYSYETHISVAFSYYADLLKKLWHPAGTQGFGKVVITTEIDSESEAVEVEIIATRITEYMTDFSTYVLTTGATSTQFVTQFATEYPTELGTETSQSTSVDYLINEPNLIINGAFTFNTDNWTARGATVMTWVDGVAHVEQATGDGSIVQQVSTTDGSTYQIDLVFANSGATSVDVYASKTDSLDIGEVIASVSVTGVSNTAQLNFDAVGTETFIIVAITGSDGQAVDIDDVKLREVPTITQLTQFATVFNRETSISSGSRQTVFNTTTAFVTAFNTQFSTVFDAYPTHSTAYATQALTTSSIVTNRSTNIATTTAFNTTFDTNLATNRATDTNRLTTFATTLATTTAYDTVFATSYATNRATTTAYNTTYDSVFATDRATTTSFNTTFGTTGSTNHATTTSFSTDIITTTLFDTSKATAESRATNRATTTAYQTSRSTNHVTDTSKTTTFVTSFNTTFVTTFITVIDFDTMSNDGAQFSTSSERFTTRSTSRGTTRSSSRATSFATTTTYATTFAESRATTTAFNTAYATTTTYATNFATETSFITNRATTTTYSTTDQTTALTNRATGTVFNTNISTVRATNRTTSSVFNTTIDTDFATTKSTGTTYNTNRTTAFNTTTGYITTFATTVGTNRSTSSVFDTSFLTSTTKLTDLETDRSTATTVPTIVSTLTNRSTVFATNRSTVTNRTTVLLTSIATSVNRQTSTSTVFVAYPTTFLTTYLTGTNVVTEYQTTLGTEQSTDTIYDTEYPTERATAVLTQTDVAD